MIVGNTFDAAGRENAVHWVHSSQDDVAMVRDFVKWDDRPGSLQHFAEIRGARLQDRDDPADGSGDPRVDTDLQRPDS